MKMQDEKNIRVKGIFYGMALNLIRRNSNVLKNLKNNRMSVYYLWLIVICLYNKGH